MKTSKLFLTLLLGTFALTALTSCLDDDDDGNTANIIDTDEQRAKVLSTISGMYNGTLYYYDSSAANNTGSTALAWTVNSDGTLTANNFPMSIFAHYTNDVQEKNIIAAVGFQKITAKVTPYAAFSSYYQASYEPASTSYEYKVKLNEEDEVEHTVAISFVYNLSTPEGTVYSSVVYETTNRVMTANVIVDKIVIDGKMHSIQNTIAFTGVR